MSRRGPVIAIALVLALCAGLLLQLARVRRVEFDPAEMMRGIRITDVRGTLRLRSGGPRGPFSHSDFSMQLALPADLVSRTVATARFREGFEAQLARLPGFERFPPSTESEIKVWGGRAASLEWSLPWPRVERLSLGELGWVPAEGPDSERWEAELWATLEREVSAWLEAQLPEWTEELRRDADRQIEIARRSLAIRRATWDRLEVSESWRVDRSEDWDARTARLERHVAELARIGAQVRELPPLERRIVLLLEGEPERPGERRILSRIDSGEALRGALELRSVFELRERALRSAEERLESETGIPCVFGTAGARPEGGAFPDLDAFVSGFAETGILERDVIQFGYRETWLAGEPRASVRVFLSGRQRGSSRHSEWSLGADPSELLRWLRETAPTLPTLPESEREQREIRRRARGGESAAPGEPRPGSPAPLAAPEEAFGLLASAAEVARAAWIQSLLDAGLWEILDPALPNRLRFGDRTIEISLEGSSTGAIAVEPGETLTRRLSEAYARLLAASPTAARRDALLADRDRIETEELGGVIAIEPDRRVPVDGFERALASLRGALALGHARREREGAPPEPWYRSAPFGMIAITTREECWTIDSQHAKNTLDAPTRHVLRIPADAPPEAIEGWLAAPPP